MHAFRRRNRSVVADSVVITAISTGVIKTTDLVRPAGAVALTSPARERLILAFERRMNSFVTHPVFDYKIGYRRVLLVQLTIATSVLRSSLILAAQKSSRPWLMGHLAKHVGSACDRAASLEIGRAGRRQF